MSHPPPLLPAVLLVAVLSPLLARADLPALAAPQRHSADEVLLLINADSPISKSIAADYVQKRGIQNTLDLHTPDSALKTQYETLPFADYTASIETPVAAYLKTHPAINFIVTTKGIPLRISASDTGQRPEHSPPETPLTTSLDSHLAAIDYPARTDTTKIQITGSGATGAGYLNRYYNSAEPFSHAKFGGYLVSRLDGYTEADAKALTARALAAEKHLGPGKFFFDVQPLFKLGNPDEQPAPIKGTVITAESPWSDYNADMQKAHAFLTAHHIPSEIDLSPPFMGDRTDLAGYFSWGSNDARYSPGAYGSLRFQPGAILDTAVSTSGRTFLPTRGGQSLIADLIPHGATCLKGYTDEPLLQANASPTILVAHYTAGYTMAESFAAASHFTRWQDLLLGDPLCAPYLSASVGKP